MAFFGLFGCKEKADKKNQKDAQGEHTSKKSKTVIQNIFGEIVSFDYSDFEDLKNNKYYDSFEVGTLNARTGHIVCTDPMYRELGLPQSWVVEAGEYPVNIYIGLEEDFEGRVAYAEIVFSQNKIDSWELSLIEENMLNDDFEKKMNGMYPVENGLSSFSDFSAWKKYNQQIKDYYKKKPEGNFYNDNLDNLFKENANIPSSSRGEDWINYKIDESDNIIMFGTGWGDGIYPRYVAYDNKGKAVKLITDFIQLQLDEE